MRRLALHCGVAVFLGSAFSILPLELAMFVFWIAVFLSWRSFRTAWRQPTRANVLLSLLPLLTAAFVVVPAYRYPAKYVDRTFVEGLNHRCATIGEVTFALRPAFELPEDVRAHRVCFSTRRPSLREAMEVLREQAGVELWFGYCGNSASIYQGGSPIGGPRFRVTGRI